MVDVEEDNWLDQEVFDFDTGLGDRKNPNDDDMEDEIFIGPVTHYERCAIKAVERLTPNNNSQSKEVSVDQHSISPQVYSVSKYTYKENSPVAVVHPICKDDIKNKKNIEHNNLPIAQKNKEGPEAPVKAEEKSKQSKCNEEATKKTKKSNLKPPSCLPSLIPPPTRLKFVPKTTGIKPLKALCPNVPNNSTQKIQTKIIALQSAGPKTDTKVRSSSTPLSTTQSSKLPGSVGPKAKVSVTRQSATPSRRRSTNSGLRRPGSLTKGAASTPRSESATGSIVPRSLLRQTETPKQEEALNKANATKNDSLRASGKKSASHSGLKEPKSTLNNSHIKDTDSSRVTDFETENMELQTKTENRVQSPENVQSPPGNAESIQRRITGSPPTDASNQTSDGHKTESLSLDDVFAFDGDGDVLTQPLIDSKNQQSPEHLLLDIDKACANSPLIKFSPPLTTGPLDPFRTGCTPVQNSGEAELLLPALAEENPVNVNLIHF